MGQDLEEKICLRGYSYEIWKIKGFWIIRFMSVIGGEDIKGKRELENIRFYSFV